MNERIRQPRTCNGKCLCLGGAIPIFSMRRETFFPAPVPLGKPVFFLRSLSIFHYQHRNDRSDAIPAVLLILRAGVPPHTAYQPEPQPCKAVESPWSHIPRCTSPLLLL